MSHRFKKQQIYIATAPYGVKQMVETEAMVCGPIAYHREWTYFGDSTRWRVTHVATGFSCGGNFVDRKTAREVAIKILESGVDLSKLDKYGKIGKKVPKVKCYEPIRKILREVVAVP